MKFIIWVLSIIPKTINGINYIFLKRPTISKYITLFLTVALGGCLMYYKAKEWGIVALITGLLIPMIYISHFNNKWQEVSKDLERIKQIATNTNLEIVFSKEEMDLFSCELMKDKEFRKEVEINFKNNQERLRKKDKKEIVEQLKKDERKQVTGSDLIDNNIEFKFDSSKLNNLYKGEKNND